MQLIAEPHTRNFIFYGYMDIFEINPVSVKKQWIGDIANRIFSDKFGCISFIGHHSEFNTIGNKFINIKLQPVGLKFYDGRIQVFYACVKPIATVCIIKIECDIMQ